MKSYCAWLKTALRKVELLRTKVPELHCRDCGWALPWDTASLVCRPCRGLRAAKIKLFCCDVDLDYWSHVTTYSLTIGCTGSTRTERYHCFTCGRIWLYITDWDNDANSVSDWYPQWTEAELATGTPPPFFDERTRTKVY